MTWEIAVLAALVALSAFFSGSESAIISLNKFQIQNLKQEKSAKTLLKLLDNEKRTLIAILIGNNLVNIWASALATIIASNLFSNVIGYVVGIMTFIILVFGEIIPKNYCVIHNKRIALTVSKPILIFQTIIFPIVILMEMINNLAFKFIGTKDKSGETTLDEIRDAVMLGYESGTLNREASRIMQEVIEFNHTKVEDIMVPINEVFVLNGDTKLNDAKKSIAKSAYSRIPVELNGEILGIVTVSEIMKKLVEGKTNISMRKLNLLKAYFIPETKLIGQLLREFQKQRVHMAFIVDEYGKVEGIVTLEDILEEIVGDILDETDEKESFITKTSDGALVDARIEIELVNKKLKLNLETESNTLNGFLLEYFAKIPQKGDKLKIGRKLITIHSVSKTRIKKVLIK